jgi:hypothetical protein
MRHVRGVDPRSNHGTPRTMGRQIRRIRPLTRALRVPTIAAMKPRKPRVGDDYTTGSFRDGIIMIVVIVTAITLIWLAYGWALGQPGVPAAP